MKVCVIGPVSPFRSGIARHTTALARELARRPDIDVRVCSFARQYPRLLFPGEDEIDRAAAPPAGIETEFRLDSLNPLNWCRAVQRILRNPPDLAVIPAWTFFLSPCLGFIAFLLKRRGVTVLMIVHNTVDHEAAWWKNAMLRFQLRQADRLLAHTAEIASALRTSVGDVPICICPHPVYDDYPVATGRLPRRAALELLFFGIVRPYKGLDIALDALAASGRKDVRLTVVGEFWQGREETAAQIERLGLDDQVEVVPRYVSDQDSAEYFARCDAVVAPYRTATGSGVVGLAQWYRRPVIASDLPGLSEAIRDGVTGWLFPAGVVPALAELLKTRVSHAAAEAMHPALERNCTERSWSRFADAVLDLSDVVRSDTEHPLPMSIAAGSE